MRFIVLFLFFPLFLIAGDLPRRVIGFWDSIEDRNVDDSLIHRTLEMPLNHIGIDVLYYDINQPFPDISQIDNILGIILCFNESTKMRDPRAFIQWAVQVIDKGKKIVMMRNCGFLADLEGNYTSGDEQNRLFERLGFTNTQEWIEYPFEYKISSIDAKLVPFERDLPVPLPGFYKTRVYDKNTKSYLSVGIPGKPESQSDLIVINSNGAYVSEYFANSFDSLLFTSNPRSLGWYVNPFQLFELVFGLSNQPTPDTTTLAGRRIFFSNIHGDSWNIDSQLEEYQGKGVSCADVVLEKIIKPNPDLPVSVGVVAADIDPKWVGTKKSLITVLKYFDTPQVEIASHTYSHPFFWEFFHEGSPEKEIDYLYLYPYGAWQNSFLSWLRAKSYQTFNSKDYKKKKLKWGYAIPRAYANEPFNLEKEITGSVDYLNQLVGGKKPVKLMIWSGDSRPWDIPVGLCYQAGLQNFGGGFVRIDPEYPSYLFVYPLARKPGGYIQLYETASSETLYTHNWKDQFYGYQFVQETFKGTETPRRLKPILLYYHSYSGEFQSSVDAVLNNIKYIRTQTVIPTSTRRYCEVGEGFFTIEIESMGTRKWKFKNRQGLQTIRFDNSKEVDIDFPSSLGIVGYIEHQGSTYIYLDAAIKEPIIALTGSASSSGKHDVPYLIDSSWEIWNLKRDKNLLSFNSQGWGVFSMNWKMPLDGIYSVKVNGKEISKKLKNEGRVLSVELELPYNIETLIQIELLK